VSRSCGCGDRGRHLNVCPLPKDDDARRARRAGWTKDYWAKNKDRRRASNQRYLRNHPEKIREDLARRHLLRNYGLTPEEFKAMSDAQGKRCAACGEIPSQGKRSHFAEVPLVVDHCHRTGRVRGLLCSFCNSALGYLHEDPSKILGLLAYLDSTKTTKETA
jgi:hypothetical protein